MGKIIGIDQTDINLPYISADASGPRHLNMKLTRAKLEKLVDPLIERTVKPCKQALTDAGLNTSDIDNVILVGGQTRMPMVQEKVKAIFGKAPRKDVDPDEAVAVGAALQGERERAVDNKSLGQFNLEGITPSPRGTPEIEVSFDIDANGILDVAARDKVTGKAQSITIKASSGLSEKEVERMVRDAKENATEDLKFRELADTLNRADAQIHEARRTIEARENQLTDADKASGTAIETLEAAIQGDAKPAIEQGMSALGKIIESLSQPASGTGSDDKQANAKTPADENVVDVEFEDL